MRKLALRRGSSEPSFLGLNVDMIRNGYLPKAVDADVLAGDSRSLEEQMASVGLYDMDNHCPTNAAVILFAHRPKQFIPGAYVQYVKFGGTDKASEILNERVFTSCLFDQLPKLDTFTENSVVTTRPVPVTAFREEQVVNYPREAIRELLLNAVMHRDYSSNMPIRYYEFSDRQEIMNAGGLYGKARPENFLPVNLRDFVHLRDNDETVNTRPSDTDILGNPRFPKGITGANDKLDRGCFETWWQRSTYVTNKELGRYPHPGSAVYLLNRYAYHPSHVDDVSKIYNDADMDISLVLDVSIAPGLILMQQGTSLYGNGHGVHTKTMGFERTVNINKGTIVALPYAMDYGADNCIWDVTNYGGSQKQKVLAEVDHDRASKDLVYHYNAVQRSQWNNIFEASNSSKWTLLDVNDRKCEAAHGVLIVPKDPMKVSYENDTKTNYQAAVKYGVRTYRFIGVARDASWAYAEEDGATTKTVTLHQRDDYTSSNNAADFTNKEDMGWNLIGLPYAVNTYYTHRRQTAMGDYTMNVPHTLWMYFDGDYTMKNHDMANTNFVNDVFEEMQKAVDERRKSKGGYYPVKAWSEDWNDWNQVPMQYQLIGVYESGSKKTENGITTYLLTDTVITANPKPRIWMGEGFFTQTAAVNDLGL